MRGLELLGIWVILASGVWGIPFTPYESPLFGEGGVTETGTKLMLKRTMQLDGVHPEIARVQAVNRAFKKFSKRLRFGTMDTLIDRLVSPVKRDAKAEILAKHYEIIKRGELPGFGHFLERRDVDHLSDAASEILPSGPIFAKEPEIQPALALDEDGNDISIFFFLPF